MPRVGGWERGYSGIHWVSVYIRHLWKTPFLSGNLVENKTRVGRLLPNLVDSWTKKKKKKKMGKCNFSKLGSAQRFHG